MPGQVNNKTLKWPQADPGLTSAHKLLSQHCDVSITTVDDCVEGCRRSSRSNISTIYVYTPAYTPLIASAY